MRFSVLIFSTIILPLLSSCGGSSDDQVADGGIGGTGVSQGKVSGYGSIFVNGIEYNTDETDFDIEEDTETLYTQADIKLGMVVRVTGETNEDGVTGTANKVEYSDQLEGIVSAPAVLDADGVGTIVVMQQTVHVDQTTVFDDATNQDRLITDLAVNDVIEVSGYSDGSGSIFATRIELKEEGWSDGGTLLEIKGQVSNLDSTNSTFTIGNLEVDYSNATPPDMLDNDLYVEVKGDSFSATGQFEADEVEVEGDGDLQIADDDEEVELEGVVTSELIDDEFSLNGQRVSIADLTLSDSEMANIAVNRELKVEGKMVDGVIKATEIEFEADESELQDMTSIVEAVDALDLNTGTIDLLGQSISVTSSTIMEDDLGDDQTFNLAEIVQYDYVKVDVYDDGNGLVAVKLERESAPDTLVHEIEGLVEATDVNGDLDLIQVLGVVIDISYTTLTPTIGDRVEISGTNYDGTVLVAESAESEEQDD